LTFTFDLALPPVEFDRVAPTI